VKKGSLNVHVLAPQNMLLAPKVNRDTKNIRERWLKGRQVDKISAKGKKGKMQFRRVERKSVGGGFLRNED
jgi:U3 small nucleolar RNA-associated protein 16